LGVSITHLISIDGSTFSRQFASRTQTELS
jgi:hypothetical protein